MAIIRKEDLETMKKVINILSNKNMKNEENHNVLITFQRMVSRFEEDKNKNSVSSKEFIKRNPKYHNILNNISRNKRLHNVDRVTFWENKLKELKEGGIC